MAPRVVQLLLFSRRELILDLQQQLSGAPIVTLAKCRFGFGPGETRPRFGVLLPYRLFRQLAELREYVRIASQTFLGVELDLFGELPRPISDALRRRRRGISSARQIFRLLH